MVDISDFGISISELSHFGCRMFDFGFILIGDIFDILI
jgi:hypothetical protein